MVKLLACIAKIIGALGVSMVCVLTSLHNDPWMKGRIEHEVRRVYSEALGEPVSFTLESIDLVRGKLKGRSLAATSSDSKWSFFCPEVTILFSWFSLLKGTGIEMAFAFSKSHVVTHYEQGVFSIEKPFYALLSIPSSLPLRLTSSTSNEAVVDVISSAGQCRVFCSSVTDVYRHVVKNHIICTDGAFIMNEKKGVPKKVLVRNTTGTLAITVPLPDFQGYEVEASFLADCATRTNDYKKCVMGYAYKQKTSSFQWYPQSCAAFVRATGMRLVEGALAGSSEIWGSIPALAEFFPELSLAKGEKGEIDFKGEVSLKDIEDFSYKGVVHLSGLEYQGLAVPMVALRLSGTQDKAEGSVNASPYKEMAIQGTWAWDRARQAGTGSLALGSACTLVSGITLDAASCDFSYNEGTVHARYEAACGQTGADASLCAGTMTSDLTTASFQAAVHEGIVSATFDVGSGVCSALNYLKRGKKILDLTQENGELRGMLDFDYVKETIASYTGHQLQGDALVSLKPCMRGTHYALSVEVNDAHIKMPLAHNVIKKARGTVEFESDRGSISVTDLEVELNKGILRSPQVTIETAGIGAPTFIHVPCTAHSLFISWDKDVCGSLSGGGVALYKEGVWTFRGSLILDKATVRGNLLSAHLQNATEGFWLSESLSNALLDIRIATRRPAAIQTSFFEAQARIEGLITGTCAAPQPSGVIELVQGAVFFPYKPLYIAKGKLTLAPHMTEGPEIELLAKNKLKKYGLSMQVTGSVLNPKISFEASPHLPESSIITLLLTGSEDASFYLAMSHVVMIHIKSILLGTPDRLSDAQKFFKSLLTPLSKVRIVPGLNEQKVLEGAIEVDLTDRLRAKAQNNVHLSEDTKLEVEYALSDEVSVKAVRDQKGALGGELEMRWKF
ncbi:translocation/assembly module TamB domain-containing protein [Candidatus Dependentiae bacterium]|nr:translocation/assembly module TamB domain-containing protein [Candidatus Dependentiae bacterium]